jgi:hypothetical protein
LSEDRKAAGDCCAETETEMNKKKINRQTTLLFLTKRKLAKICDFKEKIKPATGPALTKD